MIDSVRLFTILVEGASFTAAVAAIVATVLMYEVTKKFGSGILASGFKTISVGVFFLALGITIDAFSSYVTVSANAVVSLAIVLVKALCFVIGTYIIVVGTKKTADRLERMTK